LRKDIFELMKYAKKKGLEVRLNTNGSLITEDVSRKLKGIVDNALIPIESYRAEDEESATGVRDALKRKINAVKFLKKNKIPIVRIGTVASKKNILNLEKLAKFILVLPADEWELYRPITVENGAKGINNKDASLLVNKLSKIKKTAKKPVSIANAFPFCAVKNLDKANSVCGGALSDDGRSRLVVDARGFVKPHYFINKNIGDPLNILGAWSHPFMKRMRNLKYLPKDCSNCYYKLKCRGGSRYEAKISSGSYRGPDPLAWFSKPIVDFSVFTNWK